jgi:hypothetical protein
LVGGLPGVDDLRGDPVQSRIDVSEERVRCEVRNRGGAFDGSVRTPAPDAVGGRGLMLVDALASCWDVDARGDRCVAVWFEVDRPGTATELIAA